METPSVTQRPSVPELSAGTCTLAAQVSGKCRRLSGIGGDIPFRQGSRGLRTKRTHRRRPQLRSRPPALTTSRLGPSEPTRREMNVALAVAQINVPALEQLARHRTRAVTSKLDLRNFSCQVVEADRRPADRHVASEGGSNRALGGMRNQCVDVRRVDGHACAQRQASLSARTPLAVAVLDGLGS